MLAAEERWISVEEYLEGEKVSEIRHEYVAGQVYAMAGATEAHNRICVNLSFHLRAATRGKDCGLFMSDMKVAAPVGSAYYYPDIVLSCEGYDAGATVKSAPCLIAEVLSRKTESIDRREKRLAYCRLPSMRYYLIVAQHRPLVDLYWREPPSGAGAGWRHRRLTQADDAILIHCPPVSCEPRLADLYEDVRLPEMAEPWPEQPDWI
jgi:Uma2 family endonuclease